MWNLYLGCWEEAKDDMELDCVMVVFVFELDEEEFKGEADEACGLIGLDSPANFCFVGGSLRPAGGMTFGRELWAFAALETV